MILVTAIIAAYLPAALHGGFVWDDDAYVTGNPLLSAPDGLRRIWFSLDSPSQYFPLTYTVLRWEWALWGTNPCGYHWVNILIHALNALLAWRLLFKLGVPGAWFAAALFALHPVQVESVAWITELKNVLCLFFSLLALLVWEERRLYPLCLLLFALALSAKTTACMLPIAMLLILWLRHAPITRRQLGLLVPFVLLGLGMGLLSMWWERYHQGTLGQVFALGLMDRILIASRAVWFYAGKLLWPANLIFSYPRWHINPADPLAYSWLAAGLGACAVIAFVRKRVGRSLEVAACFFVTTLAPTLGFIMLFTFRYSFVADHYQYVACLGPLALASAAASRCAPFLRRVSPYLGPALSGGLLLLLGTLTWRQCGMYSDIQTLWRVTLERNPDSFMAHYNLGILLRHDGRLDQALYHYRRAVEVQPDFADAHNNLGNLLLQGGSTREAIDQFRLAAELRPEDALTQSNLGNALSRAGRIEEALACYQTAVNAQPTNAFFLNNLAWVRAANPDARFRDGPEAVRLAEQACRITSYTQPMLIGTLAAAYAEAGRFDEAIIAAQKALDRAQLLGQPTLVERDQELIQLFKTHQPYRDATPLPPAIRTP